MSNFHFQNLRVQLVVLILLASLPVAGLMLYTDHMERREAASFVEKEVMRFADLAAIDEAQLVKSGRQLLVTLSHLRQVRSGSPAECNAFLQDIQEHFEWYLNIGVISADGRVFCSARPFPQGLDLSDRSYFKQAMKTRDFSIGEYQIGRITGKPSIVFAYPLIHKDSGGGGVVFAALDIAWLNEVFESKIERELPEGSTMTKLDSQGVVIVRYPDPESWIGKRFNGHPEVENMIRERKQGVFEARGRDGVVRLYALMPILGDVEKANAFIVLGIPKDAVFAGVERLLRTNTILLGAVLALTLSLAWFGSGVFILRRVHALVSATRRLAGGDLNARTGLRHGKGEISQLARAFDDLAEALQERSNAILETQEILKGTNEQLTMLLDSLPVVVYTCKAEGDYGALYISRNVAAITGFRPEDFTSDPSFWAARIHPDDAPRVFADLPKLFEKGSHEHEYRWRLSDDSYAWFYDRMHLVTSADERSRHIVGVWQDITEGKQAEKALQTSAKKWQTTFDAIGDAVCIMDVQGNVLQCNKAMANLLGKPLSAIVGGTCWDLVHGAAKPVEDCLLARMKQTGRRETLELEMHGRRFSVVADPVTDENGNLTGCVHIMSDITEHVKLEQQLRQAQKMEAIGRLAGGIAHDFNNILSAIVGYGSILQEDLGRDDPRRAHADIILESANRAAALTHSLLAFSRKQIMNLRPVNVNDIIRQTERFLARIIGEDVELRTRLSDPAATIMADSGQIEQVLMNLATNARDAMPRGGVLTIGTEILRLDEEFINVHGYGKAGAYVLVSVTDTGMGMDEETKRRIFEPFYTTKESGKGTGLGLSIVYGIIKQHGGYINVYSEPGTGTEFKLYLPLVEVAHGAGEKAELPRPSGGTETILVAEDDDALRRLTQTVLAGYGYTVITAENGEDAVEKFKQHRSGIRLVVLDMIMPKKNGREAFAEIIKLQPDIKALFISGYTADIVHQKGILEEGMELLLKPVLPFDILRKVRAMLDKKLTE